MSTPPTTCFAEGTLITTQGGPVRIEDLKLGDLVVTLCSGIQPIRWIGWRYVDFPNLPEAEQSQNCPILIMAGALGENIPNQDLTVSARHGVIAGPAFTTAWNLVNGHTIMALENSGPITYYHLELDGFQIISANGMGAESFVDVGNRGAFTHQLQASDLELALVGASNPRLRKDRGCPGQKMVGRRFH